MFLPKEEKAGSNIGGNFLKSATLGSLGNSIAKVATGKLPDKYKSQIWDLALKDVSKSSPEGYLDLSDVTKKTQALTESLIAKYISDNMDKPVS